ncbi:MAG TPA: hypothetical protein PKJ77_02835 [Thermodesulfobacteriota bacterium]|nr:hypothetical protein [Deltaproteobacteria bacterium]HNR14182.1 hypothetical protein [Thermodesulfobacteriota bacterium]HNU70622.1 hypothetical protein [Thermodesulfobacteriota bacterium]HOC38194.1 hypothetical protein [Thermodesulfobacteriota bacterium]
MKQTEVVPFTAKYVVTMVRLNVIGEQVVCGMISRIRQAAQLQVMIQCEGREWFEECCYHSSPPRGGLDTPYYSLLSFSSAVL